MRNREAAILVNLYQILETISGGLILFYCTSSMSSRSGFYSRHFFMRLRFATGVTTNAGESDCCFYDVVNWGESILPVQCH